jgi:hypothetical protein
MKKSTMRFLFIVELLITANNIKILSVAQQCIYSEYLATGPKVRGFDPDRGRWIFKGDKNPEHRNKAVGPMS